MPQPPPVFQPALANHGEDDYNSSVKSIARVASPPAKPVMVYDGDCRFCGVWIRRWQHTTGDRVDYLPYQDPRIAAQFPEIPREQFASAVQLIQPDGVVYGGAEAVFRSRALNPQEQWLLDLYLQWPVFASVMDRGYRFVARHRTLFSFLTRLLWGNHAGPPTYQYVRRAFLMSLGVIYFIAFVSLWTQIIGLIGHNGVAPAELAMNQARGQMVPFRSAPERFHLLPTLCWFSASDGFLNFQCAAGTALAVLVVIGIAPAPCLFLLWLIYLSLSTVCGVFLGFQWDALLLETGFFAIFIAPLQWLPRRPAKEAPPPRPALWLLRWLLFCLMFESGCVKLLSGDSTWHNLTALNYHYETQPLPTWIGWYAHQFPAWIQKAETVLMFAIELVVPFLIFLPRRPRQFACVSFLALQLAILLTGNYCFFNLLTLALCLLLLDDTALRSCGQRCRTLLQRALALLHLRKRQTSTASAPTSDTSLPAPHTGRARLAWSPFITIPVLALVISLSLVQLFLMFGVKVTGREKVIAIYRWLTPFQTINKYGLFAVMTTNRVEIVIEGSNDGAEWKAYEFRYKPGDPKRRPAFVAPHQPRLDWQMWFAALNDYRYNPWLVNLCVRLLQGTPEVLRLLEHNPFPDAPPQVIRAVAYEYHFTDFETRRRTGEWWRREFKGIYLPPVSISANQNGARAVSGSR